MNDEVIRGQIEQFLRTAQSRSERIDEAGLAEDIAAIRAAHFPVGEAEDQADDEAEETEDQADEANEPA